jgi:MurNAc alpha-1-phosphate uridylyltransferase
MKAMVLAAGRGERLRPLTDRCPKPLLTIAKKPMIQHTIENLVKAGITDIIINLSYRGSQIRDALDNGQQFGAALSYSDEGSAALETAGGIRLALDFFDDNEPFLVVNGDIYTDFDYATLSNQQFDSAYLVLVTNPAHHEFGDFGLSQRHLVLQAPLMLTFSGIGLYRKPLFSDLRVARQALGPILRNAIQLGTVCGEHYTGLWMDIGDIQRYELVNQLYRHNI